jgi:hypothetical protein
MVYLTQQIKAYLLLGNFTPEIILMRVVSFHFYEGKLAPKTKLHSSKPNKLTYFDVVRLYGTKISAHKN